MDCELEADNYDYFCGDQVIHNRVGDDGGSGKACRTGTESHQQAERAKRDWPLRIRPASSATGFTCFAIGNADNDPFPDVYMLTDSSVPTRVVDDIHNEDAGHYLLPSPFYKAQLFIFSLGVKIYSLIFYSLTIFILLVRDERKYWRAKKTHPALPPPGDAGD